MLASLILKTCHEGVSSTQNRRGQVRQKVDCKGCASLYIFLFIGTKSYKHAI